MWRLRGEAWRRTTPCSPRSGTEWGAGASSDRDWPQSCEISRLFLLLCWLSSREAGGGWPCAGVGVLAPPTVVLSSRRMRNFLEICDMSPELGGGLQFEGARGVCCWPRAPGDI